ncbi:nuclear transport factor 2 family protein [uncultured Tolumonas sp.]|uniref:nuclear transport factor 2 family protein n=1 Tax=uncultured Tolumonas sp. TaxID=263765 RepID=UPI0029311375|nr:nuclear transport factor 2 family protein [uncultured Tolumonas sp.]
MNNSKDAIQNLISLYHESMVNQDTDTLNDILDNAYYLVHITGYVQPKHEWFQVIHNHTFVYHDIRILDLQIDINDANSQAVVSGSGIFKATIYGMNRPWHLNFKLFVNAINDKWQISHAEYTG